MKNNSFVLLFVQHKHHLHIITLLKQKKADINPIRRPRDDEMADLASKNTDSVTKAFQVGMVSQRTALKELRQQAEMTGMWSNITDEDIENADNTVQNPNEGDIFGGGMEEETEPAAINDAIPFIDVFDDWNEEKHPRRNNGQFSRGDYGTNVKVDNKDIKSYTELFKGMKTSNGIVIKSVTGHGTGRMIERGISPDIVREVLKVKPIPGNKPHTWQFDKEHYRIIVGNDGNIITAINRRRKSGKTTTKTSRHNNE